MVAGAPTGGANTAAWLGAPAPLAVEWLTVAVSGLTRDAGDGARFPFPLMIERGEPADAGRALLSGPAAALRELGTVWEGRDRALAHMVEAIRQAVDAYLSPRSHAPLVVGIVNVTPDSFSDGGAFAEAEAAVAQGLELARAGADWIDVGGESTRPGAAEVPAEEELRRVLPVVQALSMDAGVPISIDTRKASVAERCLQAGATILNDVSALTHDDAMASVAAEQNATVVLMHMPGDPATMQQRAVYEDVVADTMQYLRERAGAAVQAGIRPDRLWVDPGFGFGKTVDQNLTILRRLREYTSIGLPVLIGPSRKSTIGRVLGGVPSHERLEGTAAAVAAAVLGGAAAVRVHDGAPMVRVVKMADAIRRGDG